MRDQGIKPRKQVAGILFLILLMTITFCFYLRNYTYHELRDALRNANYTYLLVGLGMMFLFIGCETLNIHMIMKVLGSQIPFTRSFQYSCIGFYFSSITPSASGGQPAQIYYMRKDKIPVTISSITIFFIVFVYQVAMVLFGITMTILRFSEAVQYIAKLKYIFLFGVIVNTGVMFLLFLLMFSKRLLPFFIRSISKLRFLKKSEEIREKLENSIASYHEKAMLLKQNPILFFKVLFVTIIQMIVLSMIPSLVYCSLGYQANHIIDIITGQSLLTISVSAIPLPGAEGISQSSFLQAFDTFFQHDTILTAMLINRILSFYVPLVFSFCVYIFTHLRNARQFDRGDRIEGE